MVEKMSQLPEQHADPCPDGKPMWLRFKKSNNSPFYVCQCQPKAHFRNIDDEKGSGNGQRRPQAGQQGVERHETFRVSKIVCPCCNSEIIVDVHASSLGVVKRKESAPATPKNVQKQQELEEEDDFKSDGIPF